MVPPLLMIVIHQERLLISKIQIIGVNLSMRHFPSVILLVIQTSQTTIALTYHHHGTVPLYKHFYVKKFQTNLIFCAFFPYLVLKTRDLPQNVLKFPKPHSKITKKMEVNFMEKKYFDSCDFFFPREF